MNETQRELGGASADSSRSWRDRLGFGWRRWKKKPGEEVQPPKTVWDWLQLLIVPAMLAAIALAYNKTQSSREHRREDRATQDAAVLAYIAQQGDLILKHKLVADKTAAALAGAMTFATLHRVDGTRKGEIIRYLFMEQLITDPDNGLPILDLTVADLRRLDLTHAHLLEGLNLRATDLRAARFDGARLIDTDFTNADLRGASFRGALLGGVIFKDARLNGAVFDDATIGESSISHQSTSFFDACLIEASFVGARLSKGTIFTHAHGLELVDEAHDAAGRWLHRADTGGTNTEPCTNQGPRLPGVDLR
jgi:uncharacterized protein YjbI with pentapeptide repeats